MIPLMVMCVAPRASPILSAEITAFTFSLFLGLSNGFLGSVPMIQAPTKVEDRLRELTGNMMTMLYMCGLAAGSIVAYAFEKILAPVQEHPCGAPLPSQFHTKTEALNTTMESILSTVPSTSLMNLISHLPTVMSPNTSDINK